jgi:hypothetical protein
LTFSKKPVIYALSKEKGLIMDLSNYCNELNRNQRKSMYKKSDFVLWATIASMVAVILLPIIIGLSIYTHTETGTFTVKGKENVIQNKSSKYLVYTDVTTYEITDSWIHWRWDSSDVYGNMQVGKTYTATLQGYRVPFLSMYQNVIDPKEISPGHLRISN